MQFTRLDCFGADAEFHHVGVGVSSIKDVEADCEEIEDLVQRVAVAFISLNGLTVELVRPIGDDSPIKGSLNKGVKLLHVCYEVPDLSAAISEGRRHGFHQIRKPVCAAAFDNRKIAWVFSNQFGLVELLEAAPGDDKDRTASGRT